MTAAKPDRCRGCGSEDLFSGFFDGEDLAFPLPIDARPESIPDDVRWTTFCNQCGDEWFPRRARRKSA